MGILTTDNWQKDHPIMAPAPSVRGVEPLQVAVLGPPGSGKTRTVLRLMCGVQRVRSGPIVLIDTEGGRSKKYSPRRLPDGTMEKADPSKGTYGFERIDLGPPYRADRCLAAIKLALTRNPAAIGFDSLSDEHEGEGGYLEWAAAELPNVGGRNEWAAFNKPAVARGKLINGIIRITTPLFFTFRGKEKSEQREVEDGGRKKKEVVKLGWMPVAPLLLLKNCDLTCILPWDSKGKPVWKSDKLGEDFIRKWPEELQEIMLDEQLSEKTGEALARWAAGEQAAGVGTPAPQSAAQAPGEEEAKLLGLTSDLLKAHGLSFRKGMETAAEPCLHAFGTSKWADITRMPADQLAAGLALLKKNLEGLSAMAAEREPGQDPEEG